MLQQITNKNAAISQHDNTPYLRNIN